MNQLEGKYSDQSLDIDDEGFVECLQRAVTENILLQLGTKKIKILSKLSWQIAYHQSINPSIHLTLVFFSKKPNGRRGGENVHRCENRPGLFHRRDISTAFN